MKQGWQKATDETPEKPSVETLLNSMASGYASLPETARAAFADGIRKLHDKYFTPITWQFWNDRPQGTTNPAKWIEEHHGDLIGTEGARKKIGRRDPLLMQAYATWISPKRHPEDDLGLDTKEQADLSNLSAEEILAHKKGQLQAADKRYRERRLG